MLTTVLRLCLPLKKLIAQCGAICSDCILSRTSYTAFAELVAS